MNRSPSDSRSPIPHKALRIEGGSEFLIQPVTLSSTDTIKAKETCKELDAEATLFYTEIDPQGIGLLSDLFIDWDVGNNLGFMINHMGLYRECKFIQYDGLDIMTPGQKLRDIRIPRNPDHMRQKDPPHTPTGTDTGQTPSSHREIPNNHGSKGHNSRQQCNL